MTLWRVHSYENMKGGIAAVPLHPLLQQSSKLLS